MGQVVRLHWSSRLDVGGTRRDRQPCAYDAYIPDPLADRGITLDGDVAADVAEAEAAILKLNRESVTLADTEALARLLLRAESVASSRIEGLEVGGRRLLRADAARALGDDPRDVTAAEVLGNIEAMSWAVRHAAADEPFTINRLAAVHARLLAGTRMDSHAGRVRTEQNWIGGSSYNPCGAAFVPPPPEHMLPLLEDLCTFCNSDGLPAVAQAAIAHAQFETIHPFADGNGRTGRALIHMVLRRRGLTPRVLPPVSLILATRSSEYIEALIGTRHIGPPDTAQVHAGANRWIAQFAAACRQAAQDAMRFEARIRDIQERWRAQAGKVRAGSATERLIRTLPGSPVVTVASARALSGRNFAATNNAIRRLLDAGVLTQITVGRRNRAFEAADIVDAFTDLERGLASPEWDTRLADPIRAVPRRRAAEQRRG